MYQFKLFVRQLGENRDFRALANPGVFAMAVERIRAGLRNGMCIVSLNENDCSLLLNSDNKFDDEESMSVFTWLHWFERRSLKLLNHRIFHIFEIFEGQSLDQQAERESQDVAKAERRQQFARDLVGVQIGMFPHELIAACRRVSEQK